MIDILENNTWKIIMCFNNTDKIIGEMKNDSIEYTFNEYNDFLKGIVIKNDEVI